MGEVNPSPIHNLSESVYIFRVPFNQKQLSPLSILIK